MVWGVFIMAAPSGELQGLKVTPTQSQPGLAMGCASVSCCWDTNFLRSLIVLAEEH